ncbi:alpha/beta hydrolase family protein [Legionella fallonii]|uniref:Uncharacterized protein n=1 Tax=Legionella fallonii LLAP-10 TaxID=1212491 RepID=A0A098G5Y3_9GAMM|nr:alpha/beta hydrolase [Legionella fallonii]CEG56910.1 conserved protein of unknown function [Legionella fallonii LLAP-10]
MSVIKQLNEQITKLKRQTAEIRPQADASLMTTSTAKLYEFTDTLSCFAYATKNTIQHISEHFHAVHKQLTEAEKRALWNLLFEYCQLVDKSIAHIEYTLGTDYAICDTLNTCKTNLAAMRELISSMEFKPAHIYRCEQAPIDVSNRLFNRLNATNKEAAKPSFISKLITKLCVKAVTTVAETEEQISNNLKSTLLSAPNDIANYQLRVDKKTVVQAIEYVNPIPTDQWLIFAGGAGASYTNMLSVAKEIATLSHYNFLVVDYLAEPATSFADPVKIILAGAQFLLEKKGVDAKNLVLMGHSNGGRTVSQAALALPDCRVVTNNTYTSLEEVIVNNVLHGVEFLENEGISINKYSAEIINAVTDFVKKYHLDETILHALRKALEDTQNDYHSEHVKAKISDHQLAAVYTAPTTTYDNSGQKLPKAGGDKLLFEASDALTQAQQAKQQSPEQRAFLKKKNRSFNLNNNKDAEKTMVTGVKYKDSPDPARHGHHLVLKGITDPLVQNTHNVIDANLLSTALTELEKQKGYKPFTFQEQLEGVLEKYDLSNEMEHLLPPAGIVITPEERFLLIKIMAQLKKDPNQAGMPTQIQLMRLFQASDVAAEIISSYDSALDKMVWGNDLTEYKKGMKFLTKCLNTLSERSIAPEPRLQGAGSYLSKNLADTILKRLQNYHAHLPSYGLGLFDDSSEKPAKRHGMLPKITVSDLDLTRAIPRVMARA